MLGQRFKARHHEVQESLEMLDTLPDLDYVLIEESLSVEGRLGSVSGQICFEVRGVGIGFGTWSSYSVLPWD